MSRAKNVRTFTRTFESKNEKTHKLTSIHEAAREIQSSLKPLTKGLVFVTSFSIMTIKNRDEVVLLVRQFYENNDNKGKPFDGDARDEAMKVAMSRCGCDRAKANVLLKKNCTECTWRNHYAAMHKQGQYNEQERRQHQGIGQSGQRKKRSTDQRVETE
jgi:hypothetical protein